MFVQPISDQPARDMEAPASRPSLPLGHVVGHRVGAPLPSSRPESPRGHVVGHAVVTGDGDD